MCTNTSRTAQAGAPTDQTKERTKIWSPPRFAELRLGFEVTLYSGYR